MKDASIFSTSSCMVLQLNKEVSIYIICIELHNALVIYNPGQPRAEEL